MRAPRSRLLRGVVRRRSGKVGLFLVGLVVAIAVYGLVLDPYPARAYVCYAVCGNLPPLVNLAHPFGTYPTGQDVFSEVAHGAPTDLFIGFGATAIAATIGILVGAAAGLRKGLSGGALLGGIQLFFLLPTFVFIVWFYRSFGSTNLFASPLLTGFLVVLLGAFTWPPIALVTRNEVLRVRQEEFVDASRLMGAGSRRIAFRHILPNIAAPLISVASITFAANITAESLFAYLGMVYPQSDVVTWGFLIWEGQRSLSSTWWIPFFPGLMIVLTALGFTLIGDVISEELNPHLRSLAGPPA